MHYGDHDDDDDSALSQVQEEKVIPESSEYLSTDYSHERTSSSKRSLYPPRSWPSSADLAKDSDVYPVEKSTPMASRRMSASFFSDTQEIPLKDVNDTAKISILPPVDASFSDNDTTLSQIESSSLQSEICADVCDTVCECVSEEGVCEEGDMSGLSTPMLPKMDAPEFDLANIGTFIDLPVNARMLGKLTFGETLIISRDIKPLPQEFSKGAGSRYPELLNPECTEEIGGMCISVQDSDERIISFCTSQFSFEGCGATSSILSVVDRKFRLIEEKKTETLHREGSKEEKSLHVFHEKDRLTAFRISTDALGTKKHRGTINMTVEGNLVLDGGAFALMRYLVLKKFKGDIEVWSMHISGEICRVAYSVGKPKLFMINNQPRETIRIVKVLLRSNHRAEVSKSYFLPSGHLVRHRWNDCPYFIHMNPIGKIPPCNYMDCLEKAWETDVMLFSKYLDLKQEKKADIKSYLDDNRQAKSMIKDYLLCLLQSKPKYALDFTIDYFQNLLNVD